jgi:hypothetical protein
MAMRNYINFLLSKEGEKMFKSMTYEEWLNVAPNEIIEKFKEDYNRYADDHLTDEQYFYAYCNYWENLIK